MFRRQSPHASETAVGPGTFEQAWDVSHSTRRPASIRVAGACSLLVFGLSVAQAQNATLEAAQPQQVTAPAHNGQSVTLKPINVSTEAMGASTMPLGYLAKDSVTGALGDKAVLNTPFSVTIVGSEDIKERGAGTIGQIFRRDASVHSPAPAFTTNWRALRVRGLPVLNHYVDGVPMNLVWAAQLPTEAVQSITLRRGPIGGRLITAWRSIAKWRGWLWTRRLGIQSLGTAT